MGQPSSDFYTLNDPGGFFYSNPNSAKSKQPPQTDYIGYAREQGAQNLALARQNAVANNPNIKNALGSQKVTFDANGQPTISQDLNPQLQSVLSGLQGSAAELIPSAQAAMSKPYDYSGVTDLQNKAQEAILSRMEPQFQRDEDAMRTRLANQGIAPGSEAGSYDIDAFNRAKNDARMQAVLSGMQVAPQLLQEEAFTRQQPISDIRSLLSGVPSLPQFQGFNQSMAQGSNIQQAGAQMGQQATDIFNLQQARNAQQNQMLGQAGMAALMFL